MTRTESLTFEQIAQTGYHAYRHALAGTEEGALPDWHLLNEHQQEAWTDAAGATVHALESGDISQWVHLAGLTYEAWARIMHQNPLYDEQPLLVRAGWEAVVRHITNVMEMDEGEDLEAHEAHWRGWAEQRAAKIKE